MPPSQPQFDAASGLWVDGPWAAAPPNEAVRVGRVQRWWTSWNTETPEDCLLYRSEAEGRVPAGHALPLLAPVLLIMMIVVLREPGNTTALAAVWFALSAIVYGAFAAFVETRRGPILWLQLIHCAVFSSLITGMLILLLLVEHPRMHAHWIVFFFYFLLIGAMGLARDPRIAVGAGVASTVGYLLAHVVVHNAARSGVPSAVALVGAFDFMSTSAKLTILAGLTLTATTCARRGLQVRRLSIRDPLTGLLNRRAFDICLGIQAQKAERGARPLAIAMIDIDHFKDLNDSRGHPAGDAVLAWVADCLRTSVRKSDLVARYGGEEFAVAFVDSDDERLDARLEAWRNAIASSVLYTEDSTVEIRLTVSIGIARFPADASSPTAVLSRADERLYEAKRSGRNRIAA